MPWGGGQIGTMAGSRAAVLSRQALKSALRRRSATWHRPLPATIPATNVQRYEFAALSSVSCTTFMFCKELCRFSFLAR